MSKGGAISLCLLFLAKAVIPCLGADLPLQAATIDQRPALIVGNYEISHYLVEKFYRRYADGLFQEKHRAPTPEENVRWFQDFRAKQIVIAHAASLGYFDRNEVKVIVDRMERHMLAMPGGEFYKWFFANQPVATPDHKTADVLPPTVVDCTIARFNSESSAKACLGTDFEHLSSAEKTEVIVESANRGIEVISGNLPSPFLPFAELAEVLPKTELNLWTEYVDPARGVYWIFVRSVKNEPHPNTPDFFQQQIHKQSLARNRRVSQLVSSALFINEPVARQVMEKMQPQFAEAGQFSEALFKTIGDGMLFNYRIGNETVTVTADAFRRHFNEQFVRQIPRSVADLCRSVETILLEELDARAAKEQRLNQSPKFVEDRRGFAGFQVLALFEKEVLTPQIILPPAEIERYYTEHADKFRQVTKVHGRILTFDSPENALNWMKQADEKSAGVASPPLSSEEIDLSAGEPAPGLEVAQTIIMRADNGTRHGPFMRDSRYLVFEKQSDIETKPIPLAAVSDTTRETIMRPLLDDRIRQLAHELAATLKIEDRMEYARYGINLDRQP